MRYGISSPRVGPSLHAAEFVQEAIGVQGVDSWWSGRLLPYKNRGRPPTPPHRRPSSLSNGDEKQKASGFHLYGSCTAPVVVGSSRGGGRPGPAGLLRRVDPYRRRPGISAGGREFPPVRSGGGPTDPGEQRAVVEVMQATGNDWAAAIPDVCQHRWRGLECERGPGPVQHVVSLSFGVLSDHNAFPACGPNRPFLSPAIARLPLLRRLFFYRCLTASPQPIPVFLGQLGASLETLILRENGHLGPIPVELGHLTRLRVLDLQSNRLTDSIPAAISALRHLRSLDLSLNRLSGPIPDLPVGDLTFLNLSGNSLDGPFPVRLTTAHSLIKIDLSRNRLTGPIPNNLSGLSSLLLLDLSDNRLTGPVPIDPAVILKPGRKLKPSNNSGLSALSDPDEPVRDDPDSNPPLDVRPCPARPGSSHLTRPGYLVTDHTTIRQPRPTSALL